MSDNIPLEQQSEQRASEEPIEPHTRYLHHGRNADGSVRIFLNPITGRPVVPPASVWISEEALRLNEALGGTTNYTGDMAAQNPFVGIDNVDDFALVALTTRPDDTRFSHRQVGAAYIQAGRAAAARRNNIVQGPRPSAVAASGPGDQSGSDLPLNDEQQGINTRDSTVGENEESDEEDDSKEESGPAINVGSAKRRTVCDPCRRMKWGCDKRTKPTTRDPCTRCESSRQPGAAARCIVTQRDGSTS